MLFEYFCFYHPAQEYGVITCIHAIDNPAIKVGETIFNKNWSSTFPYPIGDIQELVYISPGLAAEMDRQVFLFLTQYVDSIIVALK